MNKRSSEAAIPGQGRVEALRERLDNLTSIVARRHTINDQVGKAELAQTLSAFQEVLEQLERELTDLVRERDDLAALRGISWAVSSSLDLTVVLNEVMDQIVQLTGAERSFLMLVDSETGKLTCQVARNVDRETIASDSFEISRGIVNQVATTGQPVVTTNAQMDPRFKARESVVGYHLRSILCVPLRVRGRVIGVIYADNRALTDLFSDRDRDLLTALAGQAAVAIENARLFESVSSAKTLMDNVFASIDSGVLTIDDRDRITLFNRAARRILHASEARVGSCLTEALPTLEAQLRPMIEEVKERERASGPFEIDLSLPGCGTRYLRVDLSPLKWSNGAIQGVAIVIGDLTRRRQLEARYRLFQRYLSPAVIERLPDDPHKLELGGQRQEIACLFADLRGFVDFSRQRTPEILVEILNQYLTVGANAVLSEEGTLDKFMGDAVVAFFNAPLPQEDYVLRAVRAALKIREATARLHERLDPANHLDYGIGLGVGDAIVGHIGTPRRFDYTAIGPSMNLAYRLQGVAAPGQILITSSAYERTKHYIKARPLRVRKIRGVGESIQVYELLGLL